jgi:23S rRNA pseudouridine1911/1915/1917 synthase
MTKQMSELLIEVDKYEDLHLKLSADADGQRLDAAISASSDKVSRNRAQSLIEAGDVSVNGVIVTSKKTKVNAGDEIDIRLKLKVPVHVLPEDIDIDVVYEDDDLIVVNKARGMVVHPAPGNETGTLVNALLAHVNKSAKGLSGINGDLRPGIVHRIDKNTSGLLVVAKNDNAHAKLSEQLAAHEMTRRYLGIVIGGFHSDEGTIDEPLGRDQNNRKRQRVMRLGDGRRAVTHYKVIETVGKYSLLEFKLETGRTHQIRVHMAYIGHPIYGDDLYGSADGDGQYLPAQTLGFIHPSSGEYVEFTTELPEFFTKKLGLLGLHIPSCCE